MHVKQLREALARKAKSLANRQAHLKALGATVAVSAMMVPHMAHAALDEAVTTGITAAKTDLIAVYAALTTAGVAVFVGRVIYRLFKLR